MQIAIISDTHMPRGARRLPDSCVARLRKADLILHGGDLSALSVLHELRTYGEVVAVQGNVDEDEVRSKLPVSTTVEIGATRIGLVHDGGPARGRLARMRDRFPGVDAVVFGHSHIPVHQRASDGFQLFNPGSPTERRRAPRHTMGLAWLESGQLSFELVELD